MRQHVVVTTKGRQYADEAERLEHYEDPVAEVIWYVEDAGLEYDDVEQPDTPTLYTKFAAEYLESVGVEPPSLEALDTCVRQQYIDNVDEE